MLRPWITALVVLAAALLIHAEYAGARRRVYLLKPLTIGLVLANAVLSPDPISPFYWGAIGTGLLFSLVGDVFLMLPGDRLLPGLISFSLTHIAYLLAFAGEVRGVMPLPLAAPFLIYALALYLLLVPDLGERRIPVLIYSLILSVMVWGAWGQWLLFRNPKALSAAVGAAFFLASDSVLAWHRFRQPLPWGQLAILSSYYAAQLLIAWSV